MVDRLIYLANESKFPGVLLADRHVPSLDPVCSYDILVVELNDDELNKGNEDERQAILQSWLEPMLCRAMDPALPSMWPLDLIFVFAHGMEHNLLMAWFRDAISAVFRQRPVCRNELTVHLVAPPNPFLGFEITPTALVTHTAAAPATAEAEADATEGSRRFGFMGRLFARLLKKHWSLEGRQAALWVPAVLNMGVPLWRELLLVSLLYVSDLAAAEGCPIYVRLPVLLCDSLNAEYQRTHPKKLKRSRNFEDDEEVVEEIEHDFLSHVNLKALRPCMRLNNGGGRVQLVWFVLTALACDHDRFFPYFSPLAETWDQHIMDRNRHRAALAVGKELIIGRSKIVLPTASPHMIITALQQQAMGVFDIPPDPLSYALHTQQYTGSSKARDQLRSSRPKNPDQIEYAPVVTELVREMTQFILDVAEVMHAT